MTPKKLISSILLFVSTVVFADELEVMLVRSLQPTLYMDML